MHRLTFTLAQHTPLIHFQHDQQGATLRATEVKPKLDKFLLTQLGNGRYEDGINLAKAEDWLVGKGEHPALNYKMRFDQVEGFSKQNIRQYPNYFGNTGKDHIPKNLIFAETVRLGIFSFDNRLIDLLARHLKKFFILHNFGTRQSKGFGSFTIGENLKEQLISAVDFSFVIDTSAQLGKATHRDYNQMNSYQQSVCSLFTQIELFYKSLRSGINTGEGSGKTRFYIKPAIFHYAKDVLRQQWDKKSIKAAYLRDHLQSQKQKYPENEVLHFESGRPGRHHLLLKDLFGLSSLESWRSYDKASVKKTHSAKAIDRLQSPFTFIPVRTGKSEYTVGVKISETPGRFLNQTFDIQFKGSRRLQLKTPDRFDWNDFMKYLRNDIPPVEERSESNQGLARQPEYQILSNIYNQIK